MSLKVVVVSALYPPEPMVSAQLSFDIANYLAGKGHQVTVICPYPSRPLGFDFKTHCQWRARRNHGRPAARRTGPLVGVIL